MARRSKISTCGLALLERFVRVAIRERDPSRHDANTSFGAIQDGSRHTLRGSGSIRGQIRLVSERRRLHRRRAPDDSPLEHRDGIRQTSRASAASARPSTAAPPDRVRRARRRDGVTGHRPRCDGASRPEQVSVDTIGRQPDGSSDRPPRAVRVLRVELRDRPSTSFEDTTTSVPAFGTFAASASSASAFGPATPQEVRLRGADVVDLPQRASRRTGGGGRKAARRLHGATCTPTSRRRSRPRDVRARDLL